MNETRDHLDTLTRAVTAFADYRELYTAMAGGYVPTIFGATRRQRQLIRLLQSGGFKVWGNKGRNW